MQSKEINEKDIEDAFKDEGFMTYLENHRYDNNVSSIPENLFINCYYPRIYLFKKENDDYKLIDECNQITDTDIVKTEDYVKWIVKSSPLYPLKEFVIKMYENGDEDIDHDIDKNNEMVPKTEVDHDDSISIPSLIVEDGDQFENSYTPTNTENTKTNFKLELTNDKMFNINYSFEHTAIYNEDEDEEDDEQDA